MLQIRQISHFYSTNPTVNNLSFNLQKGQKLSLLGENGSGKSTLLKLIAGFLPLEKGEILFEGERIKGPTEQLIPGHPKIKLIFQDFKLAHRTTVKENIFSLLPPITDDLKEDKTAKLLTTFKLKHLEDKKVEQLSGGEKQRLAIARALADEPNLVLMDEPFSSLDACTKTEITEVLFKALEEYSLSAIIVTHDYGDALKYSDYIGIMKSGNLLQIDTPKNIYKKPESSYAARLTGPVNIVKLRDLKQEVRNREEIYVRPENVVLNKHGEYSGTITSFKFSGPFYEVVITLPNGATIITFTKEEPTVSERVRFSLQE